MILLWFVLGLLIILGIARYNESNKLFWQLFISFLLGYASAEMVKQINSAPECNRELNKVNPTQLSSIEDAVLFINVLNSNEEIIAVTEQTAVSQELLPTFTNNIVTQKVFGRTRDQPSMSSEKPPELCFQKTILTRHDYG